MDKFVEKVVIITGSGSGFGREFALKGAALGMKLMLADVDEDSLLETVELVKAFDVEVLGLKIDVSDAFQVEELARRTMEAYGAAHLLFNNAGVGTGGFLWESTAKDWAWTFGVNVMGVANGIRSFIPLMLKQNEPAHIVNTASIAGFLSATGMGVYNASKHAVVSLTETLYHDLKIVGDKVSCSLLCPGFVPTGIANAERTRPQPLRNESPMTASQRMANRQLTRAVRSGLINAKEVADITFDAVRDGRFYIFTHPPMMDSVKLRFDDIAGLRNPSAVHEDAISSPATREL
ncbi:oxidoreductase [Caballeronia calidae]|uniref:Oxidoreductase n=1 Tax=Caballeronia calidae TaxID=1777139 RepID=A0A158EG02_9BURK|nr:SDR family oxidoreductase [Caballeronia calidae]SAL05758.1 oxidoreductase [Caballeronia calidae]